MNYSETLDQYYQLPNEEKKQLVRTMFSDGGQGLLPYLRSDVKRGALRVIADAGSKASDLVSSNERLFLSFLDSDDPKVRMLTAQILGNTGNYVNELIKACRAEQTMFTLPSYLLAIGASKTPAAKRYLEHYTLRSEHEKHIAEERSALNKALANFIERSSAHVRLAKKDIVLLECPNADVTYQEAVDKGFLAKISGGYVLLSQLAGFSSVYALRTFTAAYLFLGKCTVDDLPSKLATLQSAISDRIDVKNYRFEIEGVSHTDRLAFMPQCVAALPELINTPSSYSFELKLVIRGENALILLNPLTDKRFAYRKKSISASIAPSVAASVCYAIREYMNPEARVLDNFCGSGTLLLERGFYDCISLTGVDIVQSAVRIAQENAAVLKSKARFYHADALRFTDRQFDEVLCNMPFGLRVGTHSKNEKLYDAYVSILPKIVAQGGHAFLYTHEKHLLESILKKKHIRYLSKTTFEAGGLFPALYILEF